MCEFILQYKMTDKIYEVCSLFSKRLQELIDDFKGGGTFTGFYKLGF
jgi:hypothetical protein